MSYTGLKQTYPKARKEHACEWCNEKILKGELHLYRSYIFDGDFNSGHMHLECERAMMKSPRDEVMEGWCFGSNPRGLSTTEAGDVEDLKSQPRTIIAVQPAHMPISCEGVQPLISSSYTRKTILDKVAVAESYQKVQEAETAINFGAIVEQDIFAECFKDKK